MVYIFHSLLISVYNQFTFTRVINDITRYGGLLYYFCHAHAVYFMSIYVHGLILVSKIQNVVKDIRIHNIYMCI